MAWRGGWPYASPRIYDSLPETASGKWRHPESFDCARPERDEGLRAALSEGDRAPRHGVF